MLIICLFFIRLDVFKKRKKKACSTLMFFSTELLFKMKLQIISDDFAAQSKIDVFKIVYMIKIFSW